MSDDREMDLLPYCNRLAPWMCRVLALDGQKPLTTMELAERSQLSKATIKTLSRANSWLGFEMSTIVKYTGACGVDLLHQKKPLFKLRRIMRGSHPPAHLSTPQRKYWQSLFTGNRQWRKAA